MLRLFMNLYMQNFLTFASLMQWMPLVRIKNVRYVLTKAIKVRIFSLSYFAVSTDNEKNSIYFQEFEIQAFLNVLHFYKNEA